MLNIHSAQASSFRQGDKTELHKEQGLSLQKFSTHPRFCSLLHYQLSSGAFQGERSYCLDRLLYASYYTANQNYLQNIHIKSKNKLAIGFASAQSSVYVNGRKIEANELFILPSQMPWDLLVNRDSKVVIFAINASQRLQGQPELAKALTQLQAHCLEADDIGLIRSLPSLQTMNAILHLLSSSPAGCAVSKHQLYELLSDLVLSSKMSFQRPRSRSKLFSRTVNFLQHQPFSCRKVSDIASANHVSQRGLEKAFDDIIGMTPGEFIKALQLNVYRRHILSQAHEASRSLAVIADDIGAINYSRLSKDYKAFFGELPSETRKRAVIGP